MGKGMKGKNIVLVFLTEFIRITDVALWFAISFLGFLLGVSILSFTRYIIPLFVFMVSTFFILSFTFAINNYHDVDSDRKNPRRIHINAIATGKISKKTGFLLNLIFLIIPLFVCLLFQDITVFLFCVFLLFLGWAYSAPPLRVKGRPGFDIIWHFFGFFSYVVWGSLIAGSIELINWLVAISVGVFSCIFQVYNHILDYSFDKDSGTVTFAVWAGLDNAKITIRMLILLHTIVLFPIIIFYLISYLGTITILIGGVVIGLLKSKPKKDSHSTMRSIFLFLYYLTLSIYVSCLFYRLSYLLGIPALLIY